MTDASLVAIRMRLTGAKETAAETKLVRDEMGRLRDEQGRYVKDSVKGSQQVSRSAASAAKTATKLKTVGHGLSTYLSLPLAAVGVASGVMALDFDRSMRNVNSIAQLPERQFNRLKQNVLDLAGPTAQAPKTLAEGLYDLVSSGFDATESMVILRSSALAASAGLTTTEVSTKAIAATLNAYHLPASKAQEVSDVLFETVNRGVITFEELASQQGYIVSTANAAGIGIHELGAEVSTLTLAGQVNGQAITNLNQAITAFLKPSGDMKTAVHELGYANAESLLKTKGFQGAVVELAKHANGSKEALASYFGNVRAARAVYALTGEGAKVASENIDAFNHTAGSTNKVLKEQEKSFGFQLQRGWAQLQAVLIELGEDLLPIVVPFVIELAEAAKSAVAWFAHLPTPLQKVGLALAGMAVLAGPLMLVAGSMLQLGIALQGAGLIASAATPLALGGFGVALAAEVAAFMVLYNKVTWFRDATDAIWKFAGNQLLMFVSPIAVLIKNFDLLKGAASALAAFVTGAFTAAMQWMRTAMGNVAATLSTIPDTIKHAVSTLPGIIWGALKQTPRLLGRFTAFWLTLPIRIGYIFIRLQMRIVSTLAHLASKLPGLGLRIVTGLVRGFTHGAPMIFHFWLSTNVRIFTFLATLPFKMVRMGVKIVIALVHGLVQAAPAIWGWVKGLAGKFAGAVASIAPQLVSVGHRIASEIAHGLAQGLSDMLPGPVKKALGAAGGVASDVGGFITGGFAAGTLSAPGGLALVGERGPELVNLPRFSQVIPAAPTRRVLAPFDRSPRTAGLADHVRRSGGGDTRYLVAQPIKIGKKVVATAVTEAREDAEARL